MTGIILPIIIATQRNAMQYGMIVVQEVVQVVAQWFLSVMRTHPFMDTISLLTIQTLSSWFVPTVIVTKHVGATDF